MGSPGKKAFALRVDPGLWVEVERLAAAELRSVNAQVEVLLREALRVRLGEAGFARLQARTAPRGAQPDDGPAGAG